MIIDMNYWTKVIKRIAIFIISIIAIFLSLKLAIFYIPFLIGFIISLIIEPIIKFLNKRNPFTRKTNSIIVLIVFFIIVLSLIGVGLITLISESYNLLQNSNIYINKIYEFIGRINLDKLKVPEQVIIIINNTTENIIEFINNFIVKGLSSFIQGIKQLPIVGIYIAITVLSTYFICSDKMFILDKLEHHFPNLWLKKLRNKLKKIISALGNYLKAECILILISFVEVLCGLYIFKIMGFDIKFPLLMALITGFVDALPILRIRNCANPMGYYFFI